MDGISGATASSIVIKAAVLEALKASLPHETGKSPNHNIRMPSDLRDIEDRYYLFGMLTAFANRMQTVGDNVFEEITWKQWFALLSASILQPNPSVSQVADFVGTSHQNMKQLLLRLQATGLVRLERTKLICVGHS